MTSRSAPEEQDTGLRHVYFGISASPAPEETGPITQKHPRTTYRNRAIRAVTLRHAIDEEMLGPGKPDPCRTTRWEEQRGAG